MRPQVDGGDRALEERQHGLLDAAASPAIVKTDRLCDASEEKSSRRTPGIARIASAMCVDNFGSAAFADVRNALDDAIASAI